LQNKGFSVPRCLLIRLKIEFRKECWFDPGQGHHSDFIKVSAPLVGAEDG
jgi:hypothetical protein